MMLQNFCYKAMQEAVHKTPAIERMVKWVIFSVLITLIPLLAAHLRELTQGSPGSFGALIGRGELLLVAVALCAGGCGEIFSCKNRVGRTSLIIAGGACVVMILLAVTYYSDLTSAYRNNGFVNVDVVIYYSLVIFGVSVIASGVSVFLTKE